MVAGDSVPSERTESVNLTIKNRTSVCGTKVTSETWFDPLTSVAIDVVFVYVEGNHVLKPKPVDFQGSAEKLL